MNTVGNAITHVSGQLSDQRSGHEFARWPRPTVLEYLNEALIEVATYRPEAFSSEVEFTLVPGARQQLPNKGTLENVVNTDGSVAHPSDDKIFKAFSPYAPCAPTPVFVNGQVKYAIKSYAVDSGDPTVFYVSPSVPSASLTPVRLTINGVPPRYTLADWDTAIAMRVSFYNNVIDYMMARAYQRDTESQVSQAQAQRLFQLFYQTMGAKYKIDSARNSGYYRGEMGTGDPRSVLR